MFTQVTPAPGRPRTLDRNKKRLFCDAVSRGASMTEASLTVGVSLRTVQREARLDPDFDRELRISHTDKPDPLVIMQSAARTHWRAAAWLLERTKPEDYGRRPASSCSPYQFEEALKVVIDAALRLAPPEHHARVYAELTAASETAFKAVFPNYGPYGRHLVKRLPNTPLADAQRLAVLGNPPPDRIVADPLEPAAHLQPRALPGGRPAIQEAAATREETPGQRPGLQFEHPASSIQHPDPGSTELAEVSIEHPTSAASAARLPDPNPTLTPNPNRLSTPTPTPPPPSPTPAGRRHAAKVASPWTLRRNKSKPQRGDVAPAPWPSIIRRRSARILTPLSPKTRLATKLNAAHLNAATAAPVSREAAAERVAPTHSVPHLAPQPADYVTEWT